MSRVTAKREQLALPLGVKPGEARKRNTRRFWSCPLCARRVLRENAERHLRSAECGFRRHCQAMRARGWEVLHMNRLRVIVAGHVPHERGPVRLVDPPGHDGEPGGSSVFDQITEEGVWVPGWANWILDNTRKLPRALRIALLEAWPRDTELQEMVHAALRLGGQTEVRDLMRGYVRSRDAPVGSEVTTATVRPLRKGCG